MSLLPDPLTAARELLAGPVPQPKTMTHAEIWALLATYQRVLHDLTEGVTANLQETQRLAAMLSPPPVQASASGPGG